MDKFQLGETSRELMEGPFGSLLDRANILSEEKVHMLIPRAQAGDERAREQLVLHLVRMVYSTANGLMKMWYTRLPASFMLEDVCMAGMEGALGAIDAYDPAHANGAKLSTFAALRIKSKSQRCIYNSIGFCHIPEYVILRRGVEREEFESFALSIDATSGADDEGAKHGDLIEDDYSSSRVDDVDVRLTLAAFTESMSRYGTGGDMRPMILKLAALGYEDEEIRSLLPRRITRAAVSEARRSMQDGLREFLRGDAAMTIF